MHNALDYVADKGDEITSPIDGKVVRVAPPGTPGLSGLVIEGPKYSAKIFYITPDESLVGRFVKVGDKIGVTQEIRAAYGAPNMTNHIHLEIYRLNVKIEPTSIFQEKSK